MNEPTTNQAVLHPRFADNGENIGTMRQSPPPVPETASGKEAHLRTRKKDSVVRVDTGVNKSEYSQAKCCANRPGQAPGKRASRKPGLLALAAQVLAREMCSMSCDEILDEIKELATKSPRMENISITELDDAISREIAEKGEWSRFVHHVETDEYEISSFGDELDSAAFFEANAKSRYIVMREDGRTPEQIRLVAAFAGQEALIELCEGVIAGTRKEPEDPTPARPNKKDATNHLKVILRVEDTRIGRIRERFLESSVGQIFELAHEAEGDSAAETARNVIRIHRERSAG